MVRDVVKAFENKLVCEAAESMIKNKISHMPVVNENDRLVGMVTDIDLMACMI